MRRHTKKSHLELPLSWLPIDSRLITPFFSFNHVKGIARFFLELEIAIAILIVLGALALFIINIRQFFPLQ